MSEEQWYLMLIGLLASLYFRSLAGRKSEIKKEKSISMIEGVERGRKIERDRILGNFDSTQNITQEDFYEIIDTLKAKGYELVFNPHKGGHDIRKQVYSQVIEIHDDTEIIKV